MTWCGTLLDGCFYSGNPSPPGCPGGSHAANDPLPQQACSHLQSSWGLEYPLLQDHRLSPLELEDMTRYRRLQRPGHRSLFSAPFLPACGVFAALCRQT